ncbi:MAG: NAD(P)-binding domain-containing protein [Lachnospiraceae bacterium]|nr:NAD(P)-binding domain-containing protein [Lachnospiraceae bacterium]
MKVGFIGLGIMGFNMAKNMVKGGFDVLGLDVFEEVKQKFVGVGGKAAKNVEQVYNECDVVFFSLPTNKIVIENLEIAEKLAKPGTIVADMSSSAPSFIKPAYEKLKAKGVHLLDSPVSGGQSGAEAGTLSIMVGGDKEIFDKVKPILDAAGRNVRFMGPSGCGDVAKLVNNMIVGINIAALGESMAFAAKAGIDTEEMYKVMIGGAATSYVLESKGPMLVANNYKATGRLATHIKDLGNAEEVAKDLGVDIPFSMMTYKIMKDLGEQGHADEDHCVVAKYFEEKMGTHIYK